MILPRRIYDLGLSHKAVAVYCYLANRADKNGECFPSVRRIAEEQLLLSPKDKTAPSFRDATYFE